jgi:hypothetical protein
MVIKEINTNINPVKIKEIIDKQREIYKEINVNSKEIITITIELHKIIPVEINNNIILEDKTIIIEHDKQIIDLEITKIILDSDYVMIH